MNKYERALKKIILPTKNKYITLIDLETLGQLVDKATPKELDYEGDGYYNGQLVYDTAICRSCGRQFEVDYDEHYKYCPECGQALKWSVEE